MKLTDVVAELAQALRDIGGFAEVYEYLPKTVTPPCAIVAYPDDGEFDLTYARGSDGYDLPIVVVVGDVFGPETMSAVSGYLDGDGPRSIKAAIESIENPQSFDIAQVGRFEVDPLTFNRVEYLSAIFECTIVGSGQ